MMKWIPLSALCALAFLGSACEQHPLPGEEPMQAHEAGEHEKTEAAEKPAEEAKPAENAEAPASGETAGESGEAPKFFPEKK